MPDFLSELDRLDTLLPVPWRYDGFCQAIRGCNGTIINAPPIGQVHGEAIVLLRNNAREIREVIEAMKESIEHCECRRQNITPGCARCETFRDKLAALKG